MRGINKVNVDNGRANISVSKEKLWKIIHSDEKDYHEKKGAATDLVFLFDEDPREVFLPLVKQTLEEREVDMECTKSAEEMLKVDSNE